MFIFVYFLFDFCLFVCGGGGGGVVPFFRSAIPITKYTMNSIISPITPKICHGHLRLLISAETSDINFDICSRSVMLTLS